MKGQVFYARPRFTDNGAMIAYAGCQRLLAGQHDGPAISVQPRWPMESLPAVWWLPGRSQAGVDDAAGPDCMKFFLLWIRNAVRGRRTDRVSWRGAARRSGRSARSSAAALRAAAGQQRQGQRVATSEASELVRDSLKVSSQAAAASNGRRIEAEEHARGGGDTLPPRKLKYSGYRWPITAAMPTQASSITPSPAGDQHRQQAFADVAEQGQDGEFLPGDAQHVGRAGVAGTAGARVLGAEPAAEQDGEGEGTEQVGEDRQ